MKKEKLMEAITRIKTEWLEEFVRTDRVAEEKVRENQLVMIPLRRWIPAAVSMVLILTVILTGSWLFPDVYCPGQMWMPSGGKLPGITVNTGVLEDMFPTYRGTNLYQTVYASRLNELNLVAVPEVAYLPIYQATDVDGGKDVLAAFVEKYKPHLDEYSMKEYGEPVTWADRIGNQSLYGQMSGYYTVARCGEERNRKFSVSFYKTGNELYTWWNGDYREERMTLNGEFVSVAPERSDRQLKKELNPLMQQINAVLEKNYTEIKIFRTYCYRDRKNQLESIKVYFHTKADDDLPPYLTGANTHEDGVLLSDYAVLTFMMAQGYGSSYDWKKDTDWAFLTEISLGESEMPWDEYYQEIGQARRLSLREAEILLAKNYVFPGHVVCPMCIEAQEEVSFDRYDAVALEYLVGGNGQAVPFYAFYKEMNEDESTGVKQFAKTYVPAVDIEGLENYFDRYHLTHGQ